MKKEIINFYMFWSVIIGMVFVYLIFFPLKWFDKIFGTEWGNSIIDQVLWLSGKSTGKFE